ncbi:PrsW family glutamic-type intramembrane protease [Curtobacterium sp. MCPF17_002]|uniref:PrsW family glutamic-type intramembrane protease n=1 Tax=Curtobacterium sp. MCPF17_002 TaxID=2175645 RepID=UPI0015E8D261|nr:PrsW family glutamic-type intramembrane protease [Curtobacterium sp. MCPF17_002]WIB77004.1 PrsW family glutamic-type intramembrane protease [Curtobacterium sp. MCPF17_002]
MVWTYVGVVLLGVLHNAALLPMWIVLGSVAVPGGLLIGVLGGLGPTSDLTLGRLVFAATAGGVVAVVIGGTIDALIQPTSPDGVIDDRTLLLAGFVEEACKLAVVMSVGASIRRKDLRSGLLVGTAVGLGFAVFEDMGYAMAPFLDHRFTTALLTQSAEVQVNRALSTPLGHPLWSALLAAAVFAAAGGSRYRFRWYLPLAYLGVAVAHGLWDGAAVLGTRVLGTAGSTLATLSVGVVTIVEVAVLALLLSKTRTPRAAEPDTRREPGPSRR